MKLTNKVAVITGATDGIGKAIALTFAKEGAKVVMIGRDETKGKTALEEVKKCGQAVFIKTDVSDSSQVKRMIERAAQEFGRIDILVNNAAVCPAGTVLSTSEETWDYVIDLNLKGVFLCSKYAIPYMQKNGGGAIVNVGSINSLMAMENEAAVRCIEGGRPDAYKGNCTGFRQGQHSCQLHFAWCDRDDHVKGIVGHVS